MFQQTDSKQGAVAAGTSHICSDFQHITTSHQHLVVTFSNDAKWNTNVDNIQSSVSKHLNILRRLKYRLSRTNLDKLYLV